MHGYKWYGTALFDMRAALAFGHEAVGLEDEGFSAASENYNELAASSGSGALERLHGERANRASFRAL